MGVRRFLPSFGDVKASCFYWKSLESGSRVPLAPPYFKVGRTGLEQGAGARVGWPSGSRLSTLWVLAA